jgi:hypothetical protein
MVAPRLLSLRRYRTKAVLAEPNACARSTRGHAAQAKQLQHRLAPRKTLRLFLVRRPFVFPGHRDSPRFNIEQLDFQQMNAFRIVYA